MQPPSRSTSAGPRPRHGHTAPGSSLARRSTRLAAGLTLAALTLLAAPAAASAAAPRAATSAHPAAGHRPRAITPAGPGAPRDRHGPLGAQVARLPLLAKVRRWTAAGRPVLAGGAPGGYTATELRAYLQLSGTGAGQKVAIVDAYDDPYAQRDLTTYSKQFGLPLPCTKKRTAGCFVFQVVHPYGLGGVNTDGQDWTLEESLDMDMVHAMAPQASIVLVEARNSNAGLYRALGYAAGLHTAVVSNSWGGTESAGETKRDHYCQLATGVCTASAGDNGNPGGYPAFNPAVVAVGGTTLGLTYTGTVTSETAWSLDSCGTGGTGGGVSLYEPRPAYQDQVNPYPNRGTPDVSFDANPCTGVAVYSTADGGWLQVGGTSTGAPAWAGILASADQLRAAAGKPALTAAGYAAQQALYGLATGRHGQPLYDVTSGSNGSCGAICTAGPGYDFLTGLGSPRPGIDTALAAAP
jgi:subtilase family serine protease